MNHSHLLKMIYYKKTMFLRIFIVVALLVCTAFLLLTDNADQTNPSKQIGQYRSVEEYLMLQIDCNKTEHLLVWDTPFVVMADEPVKVNVIDRKLEFLKHYENLNENNPDGTLETWGYNWLIKIDAKEMQRLSVVLSARGIDEDGYFSQTTGQVIFAQHYQDGSYDILDEAGILDVLDFYA